MLVQDAHEFNFCQESRSGSHHRDGFSFLFQIIEMSGREIRLWWRTCFSGIKLHGKIIVFVMVDGNSGVVVFIRVKVVIVGLRVKDGGLCPEIFLNNRSINGSL